MESSPYIVEARPENFRPLVLGNSRKGPVLVFYWSPNAGPCVQLLPRLVKLADEFGGRFLLALLDTDEHKAFAQEQGVISIPTVRVYFREEIAETVRGAYSEQLFRGVLEKYLPKLVSAVQQEAAARAIKIGNIEQAITHLQACLAQQPDNARPALDLAKLLSREGRHDEAADVIDALPARRRGDPEIELFRTHLDLILTAQTTPPQSTIVTRLQADPEDYAGHYQLAARQLLDNEFSAALATLHGISQNANPPLRHRAKRGMLAVLALLGPQHALARKYQTLLRQ